jgi:NADPH2:quinone reductase
MGCEASGVVTEVGEEDRGFSIGDRVAFFSYASAYTTHTVVPQSSCYKLPDGLSTELAAAALVQGFTAHYLACDTFPLDPSHTALVHAAGGGTGALLVQMAKLRGARVIGTASTNEKVEEARKAGCDEVIRYGSDYGFLQELRRLAPSGVDVVYDAIGAETAEQSLQSLAVRGTAVFYGNSSGPPPPIAPSPTLARLGSLYVTRPSLEHYLRSDAERKRRAEDVFGWIARGELRVRLAKTFGLDQAADAHEYLESRQAMGKVLLTTTTPSVEGHTSEATSRTQ